jgi:hypothetical protein
MSDGARFHDRDDHLMREYLLGYLSDEKRADLESRYFEDDEMYDRLLDAQFDLIDAYAAGGLTPDERRRVEGRLLAGPGGLRQLLLARAIQRRARIERPPLAAGWPGTSWAGRQMAAIAILSLGTLSALGWLGIENQRLRRALDDRPSAAGPASQAPSTPPPKPGDAGVMVAEITLTARVLRSDTGIPVAVVAPGARVARVSLATDDTASTFAAAVEKAGVGRVWTQTPVIPRDGGGVELWLPADLLSAGDYEILLWKERERADTLVAAYNVRIVRRE